MKIQIKVLMKVSDDNVKCPLGNESNALNFEQKVELIRMLTRAVLTYRTWDTAGRKIGHYQQSVIEAELKRRRKFLLRMF